MSPKTFYSKNITKCRVSDPLSLSDKFKFKVEFLTFFYNFDVSDREHTIESIRVLYAHVNNDEKLF